MIARRPSKTRLEPAGGPHDTLTERGKAKAAVSAAVRSTLAWLRSPAGVCHRGLEPQTSRPQGGPAVGAEAALACYSRARVRASRLGQAVLVLLVLQSTSIVLLMRYSKTMVRPPGAGPAYPSSVAIFLAELLKLPICLGMAAWSMHGHGGLAALLRDEVAGRPWQTCRKGVPPNPSPDRTP